MQDVIGCIAKMLTDLKQRLNQSHTQHFVVLHSCLSEGCTFAYTLVRSRRRTICIRVDHAGVHVTAPMQTSQARIDAFVASKQAWVMRHLQQQKDVRTRYGCTQWSEGGQLPFRGSVVRLHLAGTGASMQLDDKNCLHVNVSSQATESEIKEAVKAWLYAYAQVVICPRVAILARHSPKSPSRVQLSHALHQWGSCNSRGVIRLSWRLIFLSDAHLDYVIAHELAHLQHMNHSPLFWQAVGALLPNFEVAKQELRQISLMSLPL